MHDHPWKVQSISDNEALASGFNYRVSFDSSPMFLLDVFESYVGKKIN